MARFFIGLFISVILWQMTKSIKSNGSFESLEYVLAAADEATLGRLPVDDLPDVFNVGCLAVEVLHIISLLCAKSIDD